jgi:hypothetical protein
MAAFGSPFSFGLKVLFLTELRSTDWFYIILFYTIRLPNSSKVSIMSGCCNHDYSLERLRERQRGTLQIVLAINALMFFVIVAAAHYAKSSSLLADSLDMAELRSAA